MVDFKQIGGLKKLQGSNSISTKIEKKIIYES
jgi:hypothetical protein